jgi:hypothetical protein
LSEAIHGYAKYFQSGNTIIDEDFFDYAAEIFNK